MSKKAKGGKTLNELLIRTVFENLKEYNRPGILSELIQACLTELTDRETVELISSLRAWYGLEPTRGVSEEAEIRGVSPTVVQIERVRNASEFSDVLMAAYPFKSIDSLRTESVFSSSVALFLDTRKEILKQVLSGWKGEMDWRGKRIFEFLHQAYSYPARKGADLLEKEKQAILAVIRDRLAERSESGYYFFTEPVLRGWLLYMDQETVHSWEEDFYMLFAIARTRNGGVSTVCFDVRLNTIMERNS